MPADTVTSVASCRWVVDHASYPPGYYLVIAKDAKGNSYRPLRFVVKASALRSASADENASRPAFWSVMNTYDKVARLRAWDDYFRVIAADPAHPDWLNLMTSYIRARHCQLQRLKRSPQSLATILPQLDMEYSFRIASDYGGGLNNYRSCGQQFQFKHGS